MTSIIKVDQIQTAAGGVPTAADLGLNVSGSVLNVASVQSRSNFATSSTSWTATGLSISYTPLYADSKLIISVEGGRYWCPSTSIQMNVDLYKNGSSVASGLWGSVYSSAQIHVPHNYRWEEVAGSTASRTYEVYFQSSVSGTTTYLNESSGNRIPISISVTEIAG